MGLFSLITTVQLCLMFCHPEVIILLPFQVANTNLITVPLWRPGVARDCCLIKINSIQN